MSAGKVTETTSKVSERISFLSGRKVRIRLRYAELGQLGSEEFTETYIDTAPMGRCYFFVFEVSGRKRLVNTENVVEIIEINE